MTAHAHQVRGQGANSEGLSLGNIFGVPVVLAWSWFLITAVIVFVFGPRVAVGFPGIGWAAYGIALGYAVLLAASVLVHELAHAVSARAFGWPTTRIVLNLWGGHTQFEQFNASPGRSLIVALVGPAANFLLAVLGWSLLGLSEPGSVGRLLADTLIWANLLLAVFNVLPGLPLDGGRIVESIVWKYTGNQERGTVAAGWAGRILVIFLLGFLVILLLVQGRTPDIMLTVVAVIMGAFLWNGASTAISQARLRLRLPQLSAGLLQCPAVALPAGSTVWTARLLHAERPDAAIVIIDDDGRPCAVVDHEALARVGDADGGTVQVEAVSRAFGADTVIPAAAAGATLISMLGRREGSEYAVTDADGRVTGILYQQDVLAAITGKTSTGKTAPPAVQG